MENNNCINVIFSTGLTPKVLSMFTVFLAIIPFRLLVSGVFYEGRHPPGPVSGRIQYDYRFLSVNNSAKIINQNSEQVSHVYYNSQLQY